jgi:hypothetical protein
MLSVTAQFSTLQASRMMEANTSFHPELCVTSAIVSSAEEASAATEYQGTKSYSPGLQQTTLGTILVLKYSW